MGLPEIVRVVFDLAIIPNEITLYSNKVLSVEKIQKIIVTDGYEAMHKMVAKL
jgi:hypothetical protein